jgi:hypothetical protein
MIIDGHRVLACFITIPHSITQYQSLLFIFHVNPQKKFVAISRDEIKSSSFPFLLPPTPKQTRPHKRNS